MTSDRTVLFHVSDIHFGVENTAALEWFSDAVRKERPDAVICTGDLTQRATHQQFADARAFFNSLDTPIVLEPGNHDMPYYNLWERFTRPYKRYGALREAVGVTLALDQIVVISLITTVRAQPRFPWSDGYVRNAALADTVAQLEAHRDDPRYKIVSCHHPLVPAEAGAKNPTIGGDKAFEAVVKAGAQAIITGHVHVPFDLQRAVSNQPIRMIGAGTLSNRLRGAVPGYNVLSYSHVTGLEMEQRDFNPAI